MQHLTLLKSLLLASTLALLAATLTTTQGKFRVITTFTVIADMTQSVAGDATIANSTTKSGVGTYDYQPAPGDTKRAQGAQLILSNGLNLERRSARFYQHLQGVLKVVVSEGIQPMGTSAGPYSGKLNPHAWISADDALTYVDNTRDALMKRDLPHADTYRRNAEAYREKVRQTMVPLQVKLAQLPADKYWLVTSEGAFSYLTRDYGLRELYLWPVNAGQQGTPQQARKVIDTTKKERVPTIFNESITSDKPMRQVMCEAGAYYGGVLYVNSLSIADGPVSAWLDLLRVTTETIVNGIQDGVRKQL